ncbi:MAG TPA: hypothetical protein DEP82_04770, partial [Arthrobacter bacterium]|nr:hypothetical protein [Arthrobacter sp.]
MTFLSSGERGRRHAMRTMYMVTRTKYTGAVKGIFDCRQNRGVPMSTTAMKHEDPRPALSRQRVVHTAIQHADSAGLDALTMRQVAGMLQVAPMALYRHISNRDDLIDA